MNKEIEVLGEMLRRMEEGTLGCSGFTIVETDAFRFAIKKLKNKHQNIILKALKYYKEHEVPDGFEELAYNKGFVKELKETIEEFSSSNTEKLKED